MKNFTRSACTASLSSLALLSAFALGACSGGGGGSASGEIHVQAYNQGLPALVYQFDVDASQNLTLGIYSFVAGVLSTTPTATVTGTCQAADPTSGIVACGVTTSTDAAYGIVGGSIEILETPGMTLSIRTSPWPGPAVLPDFSSATTLVEMNRTTTCGALEGDFVYLHTSDSSVGLYRISASAATLSQLDFNLFDSGSAFLSSYDGADGDGVDTLTSYKCIAGLNVFVANSGGVASDQVVDETPSGMFVDKDGRYMLNAANLATTADLSGKTFRGVQRTSLGHRVPVTFTFGAAAGGSVPVTAFSSSAPADLDFGFSEMSVLPVAETPGTLFTGDTSATNPLRVTYPTAASLPGLMYAHFADSSGNDEPALLEAWTMPSGKLGLIVLNTIRGSGTTLSGETITTAVEQ